MLSVSEIFGPTIQGEGRSCGKPAVFLRLGGCNLFCHWCDTPYTWRWTDQHPHDGNKVYNPKTELFKMTSSEVHWTLVDHGLEKNRMLVVTGGEPLLQPKGLEELLGIYEEIQEVEVETNGTREPLGLPNIRYNVSPKLKNSGIPKALRIVKSSLDAFLALPSERVTAKFVCSSLEDLDELSEFLWEFPFRNVYVMPEGISMTSIDSHLQLLVGEVIKRGWNITPRLHVQLWGNKRAV